MGQDHTEFTRALRNLKAHDIQSVAARMCRVLNDFPSHFSPRKITVDDGGEPTEVDVTGYRYDSMWNETVGTMFACVKGMDRTLATNAINFLYMLSSFIVKHGRDLVQNRLADLASDYTNLMIEFDKIKYTSPTLEQSEMTYSQIGFNLDQATLNEKVRPTTDTDNEDVYDFCKKLIATDINGALQIVHTFLDSGETKLNLTNVQQAHVDMLITMRDKTDLLISMMSELVMDMAHQVDDLDVCVNAEKTKDPISDLETFDPETDTNYTQISIPEWIDDGYVDYGWCVLNRWRCQFKISVGGSNNRRIALKTKYPFSVHSIQVGSRFVDCTVVNSTVGSTDIQNSGATHVTPDFKMESNTYITVIITIVPVSGPLKPSDIDPTKNKIFINRAKLS